MSGRVRACIEYVLNVCVRSKVGVVALTLSVYVHVVPCRCVI